MNWKNNKKPFQEEVLADFTHRNSIANNFFNDLRLKCLVNILIQLQKNTPDVYLDQ